MKTMTGKTALSFARQFYSEPQGPSTNIKKTNFKSINAAKHLTTQMSVLGPPRTNYQSNTCVIINMNTSVTAEDLLIHYGCDGQAVEAVGERLPQLDVESAFTCNNNKTVSQDAPWQRTVSDCLKCLHMLSLDIVGLKMDLE